MCSKVWEALLWRPALNLTDRLHLGGYAHPLTRHSCPAQSSWQPVNEWLAQGDRGLAPGPKGGTNSVEQPMLQSFLGRGSGWHCPLAEVIASHLTLSLPYPAPQSLSRVRLFVTPMDCSLPGSSVHELEWLVTPFSGGSSRPRDRTQVSRVAGRFVTVWTIREAPHRCLPPESIHLASCPRLKLPWGSALGSLTPDPPVLPTVHYDTQWGFTDSEGGMDKIPSQRMYGPQILSAKDALSPYWKDVEDRGFIRERLRRHSDSLVWDRHV